MRFFFVPALELVNVRLLVKDFTGGQSNEADQAGIAPTSSRIAVNAVHFTELLLAKPFFVL